MPFLNESDFQSVVREFFQGELSYNYVDGRKLHRDVSNPFLTNDLKDSLVRLNPGLPGFVYEELYTKLLNLTQGVLVSEDNLSFLYSANCTATDWLQNGFDYSYHDTDTNDQKSVHIRVVDYVSSQNNIFTIAEEWTVHEPGKDKKRADLVLFINGIPVGIQELKSPEREATSVQAAYNQLQNYKYEIPSLFVFNIFLFISDFSETRVGTLTSDRKRFLEWKNEDGNIADDPLISALKGLFEPQRMLDLMKNFTFYMEDDKKVLAAYHQYYAAHKTVKSILAASSPEGDGRGGVVWHTQGSGKSLTMIFVAKLLQKSMESPTVVVITDRNDLDDQLYREFSKAERLLRQAPVQAETRADLEKLLRTTKVNGLIFTTMQKFTENDIPASLRGNIAVFADEGHRSHYGLHEKIDAEGNTHKGSALLIKQALPNATFVGFTGTPINKKDRSTTAVFGSLIDSYDMTRAVKDGATVPVYYESRILHLGLDQKALHSLDLEYSQLSNTAHDYSIEESKKQYSRLETLLGAPATIRSLCTDIITHYEKDRQKVLTGKAMVVAYSREIGMSIREEILRQRPEWAENVALVMTSSNNDEEHWHSIVGNKKSRDELAVKFKDDNSKLKIVIVVDMWLTGFDVPSLATMYVYKPMKEHNLMQAIARTNRVYKDKKGGLIVDYIGLKYALRDAMQSYSAADQSHYGDPDLTQVASLFRTSMSIGESILSDFNLLDLETKTATEKAQLIRLATNYLLDPINSEDREKFVSTVREMHQLFSICSSVITDSKDRLKESFFVAVKTTVARLTSEEKPKSLQEINEQLKELIKDTVYSDGVISILGQHEQFEGSISLSELVAKLAKMNEKHLAVKVAETEIKKVITQLQKVNLVQSKLFSERLSEILSYYMSSFFTAEEVIQKLLEMANDINAAHEAKESMGLTDEELAFYDAITKPAGIKDFYENDQLIQLTKELTEKLRKNRTIDWTKKHDARAEMKVIVKRLLKKYDYPPTDSEHTVDIVIQQAELWADN